MDSSESQRALDASDELQITFIGRKSGREFSTPVWFVREGKTLFLLPVSGSHSKWYKNVLKSKRMKISSGKLKLDLTVKPIADTTKVSSVADKFRKKYGAADVKKYYSRFDPALEIMLP